MTSSVSGLELTSPETEGLPGPLQGPLEKEEAVWWVRVCATLGEGCQDLHLRVEAPTCQLAAGVQSLHPPPNSTLPPSDSPLLSPSEESPS